MNKACLECSYCFDCEAGMYVVPPCIQDDDVPDGDLEYDS